MSMYTVHGLSNFICEPTSFLAHKKKVHHASWDLHQFDTLFFNCDNPY